MSASAPNPCPALRGVLLLAPLQDYGSRYKYRCMFQRAALIEVVDKALARESVPGPAFAIVFGDRATEYAHVLAARVPYVLVENDVATARGQECPHAGKGRKRQEKGPGSIQFSAGCQFY